MGRPNRLVRVRDISTGKERDVAPEEATAGFAQGRFGMRRGQEVRIIDADGNPGTIDAEHLGNSIEQHGTRIASDDDFESARFRREHDDLAGAATAAGQGFVREALPFGVGEELLDVAGSDSNRQRMYQDVAPVSSTLGSIGGAIIPLALSGGETAVARGALEGAEAATTAVRGAEALNAARGAEAAVTPAAREVLALEANASPRALGATRSGTTESTLLEAPPGTYGRGRMNLPGEQFEAPQVAGYGAATDDAAIAQGQLDALTPAQQPVVAGRRVLAEDVRVPQADYLGGVRIPRGRNAINADIGEAVRVANQKPPVTEAPDVFINGEWRSAPRGPGAVETRNTANALSSVEGDLYAGTAQGGGIEAPPDIVAEFGEHSPAAQAMQAFDEAHAVAPESAATGWTSPSMDAVPMTPTAMPRAPGTSIVLHADSPLAIAARTTAIDAGVAPLSRSALTAEDALMAGDRIGFGDVIRGAARAVSAPARGVTAIGEAAGELAGGGLRGALAQGSIEGSIYGASNYVNQSMLHDQPLTAEGLAMAVGEGALFGGGANLALHGVGGLVGAARRGVPNASLAQSFEQTMNRSAVRALHPTGSAYTRLAERFVPGEAGQAAARGGMRNVDDMGAFLIKEGLFESPRGIMPPSIQEIAQRLEAKVADARIAVANPVRTIEAAGVRVTPTQLRAEIARHAEEMMTSPLKSVRDQGKRIRDEFAMLSDHERPTSFHRMRQKFDDKAHFEQGNQAHNAEVAMYQDFRRAAQKDLQAAVDAASPELGANYRVANDRLGKLAWANTAAQKAVGRNLAGSSLPLGSLISGAGAGALFGGVSPQALAVGFLSGALHKWVKENGAALATSGLSAMMKANTLNRVATAVRSNAVRSVKDAFATAARVGVVRAAASRPLSDRQFQQAATSLYALSHDPEATLAASQPLQGIQASAPSAGLAAQQVQAARLRYLANLLPGAQAPDPLSALVAIRSATPAQMAQFGKAFAIAKDPSTYLQSFADHTITAETTAHMRALWPATYGTMAQTLMTELESRNEPLSPGMRRTVSVFMGQQPVDQSPAYIMLMQANYGTQPTQGGQPQAASGAPAIDGVAERALTGPQATEARIAAGGPGS